MRQAYDRRLAYQIHREWEDFQAQIQEVPNSGYVRLGELHAPRSNIHQYNMR